MKRAIALSLLVVGCLAGPAAAQYMPGTQERISHWSTRTYWPGGRHHWPGYGYGGRGYGVQPPVNYSYRSTGPELWRMGNRMGELGYRAIYKPRHESKGRPPERYSRRPTAAIPTAPTRQ